MTDTDDTVTLEMPTTTWRHIIRTLETLPPTQAAAILATITHIEAPTPTQPALDRATDNYNAAMTLWREVAQQLNAERAQRTELQEQLDTWRSRAYTAGWKDLNE